MGRRVVHGLDDTTKVMSCSKPATSLTGKVARATLQPRSFEVTEIEAHAGRDILNAASPASKGGSVAVNDESWRRAEYVIRAKDSKEGRPSISVLAPLVSSASHVGSLLLPDCGVGCPH